MKKQCYVCEYAVIDTEATHLDTRCINQENKQKIIYADLCDDCYENNRTEMFLASTDRYYDWRSELSEFCIEDDDDAETIAQKIQEFREKVKEAKLKSSWQSVEELTEKKIQRETEMHNYNK